jgi:two-component sensor histidine kinase
MEVDMRRHVRSILLIAVLLGVAPGTFAQSADSSGFNLTAFPFGTGNITEPVDLMVDGNGYAWLMDQHAIYCLLGKIPVRVHDLNTSAKVQRWQGVTKDAMTVQTSGKAIVLAIPEPEHGADGVILSDPHALRTLHLPDGCDVQLTDSGSLVIKADGRTTVQPLTIEHHSNRFALIPGAHGRMVFDPRNGIWILGRNGMMLASHVEPAFRTIDTPMPLGKSVQVTEDPNIDRRFVFARSLGLLVQELSTGRFIKLITHDATGERIGGTKWRLVHGQHYFHGDHCIYRYDPIRDTVITILDLRNVLPGEKGALRINDFEVDGDGRYFYMGTADNLLFIFDLPSNRTVVHEVKPPGTFSGINLILGTAPFGTGRALIIAEHGQFLTEGLDGPVRPAQEDWPSMQFGPNFRGSDAMVIGDTLVIIPSFSDGMFAYNIRKDSLYRPEGPDIDQVLISDIFRDGLDHIYGTSRKGLLMYNVRDNTLRLLNDRQGLPLDNLFYRYMSNGAPGEMFLGLTDRYLRFTTADLQRKNTEDLFIERTEVNGRPVTAPPYRAYGSTIHLNYLQNNLGIGLGTPLVSGTPFTSFFVRLADRKDQVEFHEARDLIRLTAMAPGQHRIQLAFTRDGPFTDLLTVDIAPPLWRTWWFITLLIATGLTILLILFRARLQFVRHEARMKAEFDTRIAQLELSSLRAQMHPHFIFNSLNSIKSFIADNEPRTATRYLNKFSQLIRSILNNSRHARVDLRSELKALELYLELEQMRFEGSFERSITVDPDIDQDAISIPPLILQPYAENAIWHGLMHKQGDRRLEVEISQSNGMLHTSVRDNGIGRSAAQKLKTRSATKHKGLGMDITSEIIKRTHDDGTTGVVIKDLFDAHGDPSGTEVHITIPIVPRP